ncbi:MAG: helix-turn-helix domain-containing protein [Treponema sp.]|nr:helix-turn-helix domain-containing protein [Treponema sp.]
MDGENVFNIRNLFSRNLKRLRNAANISQLALAGRANLTHNFINDIENGKKWVSDETIGKLATALRAEPYQFFLSESRWNEKSAEILATYLGDIQSSFIKLTEDYRLRFIPDNAGRTDEEHL